MKVSLESEIIRSYKRLSYTHWHALAEFVDNSTQAYLDNREFMHDLIEDKDFRLEVKINYDRNRDVLIIQDNSIGMNETDLENAMKIGMPPEDTSGRSRYGLGLKTAACWFGEVWELKTTKLGSTEELTVVFNVEDVAAGNRDLNLNNCECDENTHYTIIEISKLNRRFAGRTVNKIKEYLRSFYREDTNQFLDLYWSDEKLIWDIQTEIYDDLIKKDGKELIEKFDFEVNGKKVTGWAGVFLKGGRKKAGFSILHNGRVVRGWPDAYRPNNIFGDASNDLINQRLVGVIDLGEFEISHTKDQILYGSDDEDKIEDLLEEELETIIKIARDFRKGAAKKTVDVENFVGPLSKTFSKEMSGEAVKAVDNYEETSKEAILVSETNISLCEYIINNNIADSKVKISGMDISLYLGADVNADEQYVLFHHMLSESGIGSLGIVLNLNHPYLSIIENPSELTTYFRHSIYDAISLWEITKDLDEEMKSKLELFSYLKDTLLRSPVDLEVEDINVYLSNMEEN